MQIFSSPENHFVLHLHSLSAKATVLNHWIIFMNWIYLRMFGSFVCFLGHVVTEYMFILDSSKITVKNTKPIVDICSRVALLHVDIILPTYAHSEMQYRVNVSSTQPKQREQNYGNLKRPPYLQHRHYGYDHQVKMIFEDFPIQTSLSPSIVFYSIGR